MGKPLLVCLGEANGNALYSLGSEEAKFTPHAQVRKSVAGCDKYMERSAVLWF